MARSPILFPVWLPALLLLTAPAFSTVPSATAGANPVREREALAAFNQAQYDRVIGLFEALPPEPLPSTEFTRIAMFSYLRLGQADAALKLYTRLVPSGQPDKPRWLRDVAMSVITSRARDSQEYVRIAVYSALADLAGGDTVPLLEDGLLDSSVLVRAKAVEGLGRINERATSSKQAKQAQQPPSTLAALKRALDDAAPAVRIAALNALGDSKDTAVLDRIARIARVEEGAVHVFALAALAKLGRSEALGEILSAATLPDQDSRMAAVGVLGRLKRPSSLSLLGQSVYDPDPSVRAFAAGALGEFGDPQALSSLTHALGDENPRVRSIAAASLGRLKLTQARPLLKQAARDPVELARAGAVEGLLRLGDSEAVLLAADLAKHGDPSVRSAAALALGLAGNQKAIPVLGLLLQDQQPQPRLTAARALGKLGGQAAVPLLKRALADADPAVRVTAAGSLIQILSRETPKTKG